MAGPFVVVVAGVTTAWLAIRSNDGLVADDYYKQGLAINQQLERDHKASELGVQAQVLRSGMQIRALLAGGGQTKLPDKLRLRLSHPTRAGMDQAIELAAEGQGVFNGKLSADISGRWHVVLEDPSGQWRLQGDWLADAMEPLQLGAGVATSTINRNVTGR
jgi:hypothetical protein